jgi:fructose-bisphosphate aldolase/2-amino-3,7-dideoxy-D-threo-hept-6-ulosonate synthase
MGRLFDRASGTSIIIPMDHGIEEAGYTQLEDPRQLVADMADAGVDAFLMRRGLARFTAASYAGKAGWIQRITGRTGLAKNDADQLQVASVEGAMRSGADAVVPTVFLGGETEKAHLPLIGMLADECNKHGMPLLVEVFPTGDKNAVPYDGPYTVADMRIAVRSACEEGADFIKTWYTGDPATFSEVVAYATVPVLIAGGPKARDERQVLEMVKGAMEGGAKGVAMGRKIWQSANPVGVLRGLQLIIRHGASVDDAMEAFRGTTMAEVRR